MSLFEFVSLVWRELALDYTQAFNPPPGLRIPKLFICFDFCASLLTVVFSIVVVYSLLLHVQSLRLRRRLLCNIGAVDLARLESQA